MAMMRKKRPTTYRTRPVKTKCSFCEQKTVPDYKEWQALKVFVTERGKLLGRSKTGICAKHQRKLTVEVKRARHLARIPFVTVLR